MAQTMTPSYKRLLSPQVSVTNPNGSPNSADHVKRLCFELQNLKSPSKSLPLRLRPNGGPPDSSLKSSSSSNVSGLSQLDDIASSLNKTTSGRQLSANFPLYTVESVENRMGYKQITVTPLGLAPDAAKICRLKGFWVMTNIAAGDQVMILGKFDESGICDIDDSNNLLIQNPDTLISPTLIGGSFYCTRKALLQDMIRSETTQDMFVGTLVHDLMQRIAAEISMAAKTKGTPKPSKKILSDLLHDPRYRQDMYALNLSEESTTEIATSFIPNIEKWAREELTKPGVGIADIEEWLWSPRYGVKGRVDMTLQTSAGIIPLEIKTGKPSFAVSQTGQVLLYTLLLSEKHHTEITEGILYYAKTGEFKTITAKPSELSALVRVRNDISHYLKKSHVRENEVLLNLPSPINNERSCSTCPLSTMCALYYERVEKKRNLHSLPMDHYIHQLVSSRISHLSETHLAYFEKWMIALYMEVQYNQKDISVMDLWKRKDATENHPEKPELTIRKLRLKEVKPTVNQQLIYCLTVAKMINTGLQTGDLVLLREDSNEGLVMDLCTITLIEYEPSFRLELQADRFFMSPGLKNRVLRIDKYVFSASAMGGCYDSLVKIMENGEKPESLRGLFLDLVPPGIGTRVPQKQLMLVKDLIKPLAKQEQLAMVKCMVSTEYVVLDTKERRETVEFVSTILRVLCRCCLSVLFVCSSNTTLDSVLLAVKPDPIVKPLRLGPSSRAHTDVRDLCVESVAMNNSYPDMCRIFQFSNIVATTNGNHRHPALMHRQFDVCVVHEASFMLQPSIFGFLLLARRYILIGDSTKVPNARCGVSIEKGIQESLLESVEAAAKSAGAWVVL